MAYTKLVNGKRVELTPEEVQEFLDRQEEYDPTDDWENNRQIEYPKIGRQLEAIWIFINKAEQSGITLPPKTKTMLEEIKAIQLKYPEK